MLIFLFNQFQGMPSLEKLKSIFNLEKGKSKTVEWMDCTCNFHCSHVTSLRTYASRLLVNCGIKTIYSHWHVHVMIFNEAINVTCLQGDFVRTQCTLYFALSN